MGARRSGRFALVGGYQSPAKDGAPDARLARQRAAQAVQRRCNAVGVEPSPIPTAINSVPRDGRASCIGCPQCVGHACPVDAKNGTHNTVIPRAISTGNCDLLMSTQVVEIVHDGRGTATAVRAINEASGEVRDSPFTPVGSW